MIDGNHGYAYETNGRRENVYEKDGVWTNSRRGNAYKKMDFGQIVDQFSWRNEFEK